MTRVGAGGVSITGISFKPRFKKDVRQLTPALRERLFAKLKALRQDPIPSGLRFEKLQGYSNPEIFTFHVDGNYKVSLEIRGSHAILRRVSVHKDIDRLP